MSSNQPINHQQCIVNLSNSILKDFGVEPLHPTLPQIDEILKANYRNVILLILDGLGADHLRSHLSADHPMKSGIMMNLHSVFPPTTTAATTSLLTGKYPIEHGWLGWSLHFDSLKQNIELYTGNDDYDGQTYISHQPMDKLLSFTTIVDLINTKQQARADVVSPYGNLYVDNWEDQLNVLLQCTQRPGRNFLYAYYDEPDHSMHRAGVKHYKTTSTIQRIANDIHKFINQLSSDTLLLISADHGHIDVDPVDLTLDTTLWEMLKFAPTMEARAINFHIKPEYLNKFSQYFTATYPTYQLITRNQALEDDWFGIGKQHFTVSSTLGDYLAVAQTAKTLFFRSREFALCKGAHAGMTELEITVPLVVLKGNNKEQNNAI